jgi:hypothetical protein
MENRLGRSFYESKRYSFKCIEVTDNFSFRIGNLISPRNLEEECSNTKIRCDEFWLQYKLFPYAAQRVW